MRLGLLLCLRRSRTLSMRRASHHRLLLLLLLLLRLLRLLRLLLLLLRRCSRLVRSSRRCRLCVRPLSLKVAVRLVLTTRTSRGPTCTDDPVKDIFPGNQVVVVWIAAVAYVASACSHSASKSYSVAPPLSAACHRPKDRSVRDKTILEGERETNQERQREVRGLTRSRSYSRSSGDSSSDGGGGGRFLLPSACTCTCCCSCCCCVSVSADGTTCGGSRTGGDAPLLVSMLWFE